MNLRLTFVSLLDILNTLFVQMFSSVATSRNVAHTREKVCVTNDCGKYAKIASNNSIGRFNTSGLFVDDGFTRFCGGLVCSCSSSSSEDDGTFLFLLILRFFVVYSGRCASVVVLLSRLQQPRS